jgi:sec-independent protein translocase protein TatA
MVISPLPFLHITGIMGLGVQELMIILVIILVLFGSTRIPQILGGLGEGIRSFKKGIRDDEEKERLKEGEKP